MRGALRLVLSGKEAVEEERLRVVVGETVDRPTMAAGISREARRKGSEVTDKAS